MHFFTEEQLLKISQRKHYIKKQKRDTASSKDDELDLLGDDVDSFTGSQADLESAADNLFTSPPHPQPLPFSPLSIKMPTKTVPPTPGTALQQKIESNLEKSLGNTRNIQLQQQIGFFQASMLEAFQSLRDELTTKKQAEVDQTSASASKPGPSTSAVNLDLPPPRPRTTSHVEEMEEDYGPALPPCLGSDLHNASDQNSNASEEPSKKASDRPKKHSHSHKRHEVEPSSACTHCLCLPSNGSPSLGDPKNQALPLPDHRNSPRLARDALVLGPSAALNRDPTTTSSVNNSSQTVPQLCVPQQSTASQPPRLVSRSGQLQEQGFSVEVAERIAAPQRSSTRTIYKSKWTLFEKWCRENSVDFSTPSVKQSQIFSCTCTKI